MPHEVEREVERKTSLWGWITTLFGGSGAGGAMLFGMQWQTVAVLAAVALIGILILIFLGPQPLALWWSAVILDSIFMFPWDVADFPTKEMKDAAARMIEWVFYVGGGVAGAKALIQ